MGQPIDGGKGMAVRWWVWAFEFGNIEIGALLGSSIESSVFRRAVINQNNCVSHPRRKNLVIIETLAIMLSSNGF